MEYKKGGKAKKKGEKVAGEKGKQRLDKFARGGAAKKAGHKTQVNVMVGAPHLGGMAPPSGPAGPMPGAPVAPPPGMAPHPPMPPGPPGMGPMPGARPPGMKTGGKVPHMTAGALSGEGRLQKTKLQKGKK